MFKLIEYDFSWILDFAEVFAIAILYVAGATGILGAVYGAVKMLDSGVTWLGAKIASIAKK